MASPRHVLLLSLVLLSTESEATSGLLYKRAISPAHTIHSDFKVVDTKPDVPNLSECATHVHMSLGLPDSEATGDKTNAFKYDSETETCTVGRLQYTPKILSVFGAIHEDDSGDAIYIPHAACDVEYEDLDTTGLLLHYELLEDLPGAVLPPSQYLWPDAIYDSCCTNTFSFDRTFIDGRHAFNSGASAGFYVTQAPLVYLNSFSTMMWFYSDSGIVDAQVAFSLSHHNANWFGGFLFTVRGTSYPKRISLTPGIVNSPSSPQYDSSDVVPAERWVHLAAVYNYEARTVDFYMDGRQIGGTVTNTAQVVSYGNQARWGSWESWVCQCSVADMALYDRPLDAAEVFAAYNRFKLYKTCP